MALARYVRRMGWSLIPRAARAPLLVQATATGRPPRRRHFAGGVRRNERRAAIDFVVARGYEPAVARGVVEALMAPGSGITAGTVLAMVQRMAGRYEIGEDAGLEAMARAVEQEIARTAGRAAVAFTVRTHGGRASFECEGLEGMSLRDVVEHGTGKNANVLSEYIECACDGIMACSTCHVYVGEAPAAAADTDADAGDAEDAVGAASDAADAGTNRWFAAVGEPSEAEQDMLDLAHDPRAHSRLGCQVVLSPELDGLVVTIPGGSNNLFDDIPFE